ncbi:hypothetical protein [Mycobacterium sp. E3198]|uniref:hypothetical protein n=1 Tax=Mycobacterium sp. E3198 TaxID=1834143 RepID=UPI0007FE4C49|nr:hypothetical protein [Mycobacterium sp. E3198]OBG25447.1 hypothetical protein A5673_09210 [Mycobacterium sp. E3198]
MKRKFAVNWPLAVVLAATVASVIMAVFVYGLSDGNAALFVFLKATVLGVGLLWAWLTVRRARRKSDGVEETEVGEVGEVSE